MNELYQIVDSPLPPDQDFKYLKEEGLAFIQKCTGNQWTNFNASDPGVTILDQVCYALTELGYCNDFPVADILTGPDGKLKIEDQFYLPEEILTTSPLTIPDYRKFIIDTVEGVENAIIIAYAGNIIPLNRCYQVYLFIDASIDPGSYTDICKAAFYCLNKSRNLGELFLMPEALEKKFFIVEGEIQIKNEQEQNSVLLKIQTAICNYIFPEVQQKGYNQLIENGVGTDQVFNGPLLKNGWITDEALGTKRDQLDAFELGPVIESVPGVVSALVSGFYILPPGRIILLSKKIECEQNELLFLDILKSRVDRNLTVICNNTILPFQADRILSPSLAKLPETEQKIVYGAKANIHAELPRGNFRDISTYYSIQNTFPEIFALGDSAIPANAPPVQLAWSRQLKGYLTLFDQVLANQFAQLANIASLFSFKNSTTGTPTDLESFNAAKTAFQRKHQEYPVPYKIFSPTYYYQSLYDIPGIRPVLKNNDVFNYSPGAVSESRLEEKSWTLYKQDPYNAYIYGLMELMEDESLNMNRRNQMLNHLLARHGESPVIIEAITDGFTYTGNAVKDKVIFKSLYLQNLYRLSYNRQKAYNYLGADEIDEKNYQIMNPHLSAIDRYLPGINVERIQKMRDGYTTDFIFNSGRINRMEKISERDLINYSTAELKLSLLFGLKFRYIDFIKDCDRQKEILEKSKKELDLVFDLEIIAGLIETASDLLRGRSINVIETDIKKIIERIIEEGLENELLNLLERQVELKIRIALWFIEKRRGLILIETALLWKHFNFNLIITQNEKTGPFWIVKEIFQDEPGPVNPISLIAALGYEKAVLVNDALKKKSGIQLKKLTENYNEHFKAGSRFYRLIKHQHPGIQEDNYQRLNTSDYLAALTIAGNGKSKNRKINYLFESDLLLVFPDTIKTPGFNDRLDLFMQSSLPVTVNWNLEFADVKTLKKLIPVFSKWHESLRFHPPQKGEISNENAGPAAPENLNPQNIIIDEYANRARCTRELVDVLIEIYFPKE